MAARRAMASTRRSPSCNAKRVVRLPCRRSQRRRYRPETHSLGISSSSGRDVRQQLLAGNVEAMRLTHEAGRLLSEVMATVVCLLNPAVLLIAGDLTSASLIGGIRETLYPMSLPRATRNLDVRLASLGEDAGVRGMSSLLVNQVFAPGAVNARLA